MLRRFICEWRIERLLSVVAFVAVAATVRIAAGTEIVERCGIGPSPDSPNFAPYLEDRKRVRAELGYEPVCDELIASLNPSSLPREPLERVRRKLAFQPIPLDSSLFAGYRLLGAAPDIGGDARGASALRRYFAGQSGEVIELFEFDTSLGGGVFVLDSSQLTERIKGNLATLIILQSRAGKAISILSWDENRRHIEMTINRNIRKDGYAEFIRLAESIPEPTPAQPDAPMPTAADLPPPFGPGPDFPPHPPK